MDVVREVVSVIGSIVAVWFGLVGWKLFARTRAS